MNPWIRYPVLVLLSPLWLVFAVMLAAIWLVYNLLRFIDAAMMNEPFHFRALS